MSVRENLSEADHHDHDVELHHEFEAKNDFHLNSSGVIFIEKNYFFLESHPKQTE